MGKITVIAVGAGNRMDAYTEYALRHPEELEVVAVAEPNRLRRMSYASRFRLSPEMCLEDWTQLVALPRLADAVFLCTPDHLHYEPVMALLDKKYDILLEKPIARSWQECSDIAVKARQQNCLVSVCHVLRYHPYFMKFREILSGGSLGKIVSVNHVEAVGIERMTHAFVRGLWNRADKSNPMILSKSCHDLDLLVWLIGVRCVRVSSYGSLKWFRPSNAPQGSTYRCTDGCAAERNCPYSALSLYYRQKRWLRHFDIPPGADEEKAILDELRTGPYGRCVYHCDNDVVDHQVVSMQMEEDITVNFSMDGFTKEGGRTTHVMCTEGEIWGDEKTLAVRYFLPDRKDESYDFSYYSGECNFHGGADLNIVADFVKAVRSRDGAHLLTGIENSLESHRIAFEIEKARLKD